jgi:hypothetical protein
MLAEAGQKEDESTHFGMGLGSTCWRISKRMNSNTSILQRLLILVLFDQVSWGPELFLFGSD